MDAMARTRGDRACAIPDAAPAGCARGLRAHQGLSPFPISSTTPPLPPLQLLNLYQKVQAEIMTRRWVPNTAFSEQCKAVRDTQDPEHVLAPI